MKKLIVLLTTLSMYSMSLPTLAQQQTSVVSRLVPEFEQKATQALQEKLKKINGFNASFSQRVIDSEGQVIANGEGQLVVEKPNKVNWHTTSPDETLIIANGETLWFYDPFIEQVSVYHFKQALANTPILLLSSDDPALWHDYRVLQVYDSFVIESLNEQSQVAKLQLKFKENELSQLVIFDATGQISEISLTLDETKPIDDKLFDFVIPQGTHIDDQRQ